MENFTRCVLDFHGCLLLLALLLATGMNALVDTTPACTDEMIGDVMETYSRLFRHYATMTSIGRKSMERATLKDLEDLEMTSFYGRNLARKLFGSMSPKIYACLGKNCHMLEDMRRFQGGGGIDGGLS